MTKSYIKKETYGTFYYKDKGLTTFHRKDGPAIEWADGSKSWWQNGKRHREDGPAIEYKNSDKHWFLDGKEYSQASFKKEILKMKPKSFSKTDSYGTYHYKDSSCSVYHREDGPAVEYYDGTKHWYLNGKRHREDGPAIEYYNGSKEWYLDAKLHREDGPAIEHSNGTKTWYLNGKYYSESGFKKEIIKMKPKSFSKTDSYGTYHYKDEACTILHKEDGPAREYSDGDKHWWLNGKLHRIDGPAIEYANGDKSWWLNGKRHREAGPAFEFADGSKFWYLNDREYSEVNFKKEILKMKSKQKNFFKKDSYGNTSYYKDEACTTLHREDGPAIEYSNGDKAWYLNGKCHRENKPAIEHICGTKEWYLNNKRHREDGPAVEHHDGSKLWYLNGSRHRLDGPAVEYANGDKNWYVDGKLHREDGPAVEYADGDKHWWFNDKRHRVDGPAIEYADGYKEWYLNGKNYSEADFNKKSSPAPVDSFKKVGNLWREYDAYGKTISYFKDKEKRIYHKLDGPAFIDNVKEDKDPIDFKNHSTSYYTNDKLHRIDGPAHTYVVNGKVVKEEYYIDDFLVDKKDVISTEKKNEKMATKKAIKNPTTVKTQTEPPKSEMVKISDSCYRYYNHLNQSVYFYKDEKKKKIHRENGPAVISDITFEDYKKYVKDPKPFEKDGGNYGLEYRINGKLHRLDGPAEYYPDSYDGITSWYKDGQLHRENGPAQYSGNEKDCKDHNWFLNGKLHRLDGPACEYDEYDDIYFYINGKQYSSSDFVKKILEMQKDKVKQQLPTMFGGPPIDDDEDEDTKASSKKKISNKPNLKQEVNTTISKSQQTIDMVKDSMKEGAKRNGVRQVVKGGITGVQTALVASGVKNEALIQFLNTPIAEAIIKAIIGYGAPNIPQFADNKLAILIANECRNQSAEDVQKEVFDKVMEFIVPAVMGTLSQMQDNPTYRVLVEEANKMEKNELQEEEELSLSKAKMK